jgi:citrate/tricarballylate utilization protein
MYEDGTNAEAMRQLQICNACRYCEGYCDMFGALGRLPLLAETDVAHLANICHDCRACYQACMYTDPHEFAVNIPKAMSTARLEVYETYAPPKVLSRLLRNSSVGVLSVILLLAIALTVFIGTWRSFERLGRASTGPGSFYLLVPSWLMISAGFTLALVALALLALGQVQYWRSAYRGSWPWYAPRAWMSAVRSAAVLAAMKGGGAGCYYPQTDSPSQLRRWMHGLTAYGFLATFAATCAAAIYEHAFDQLPPYRIWSAPVLLGTVGGAMMLIGVGGLMYLKATTDRRLADDRGRGMEYSFLATLFLLAATGLMLLLLRDTQLMPSLLVLHLAVVGAFFLTVPYGKMVHAAFRFSALLKDRLDDADERRERERSVPRATDFTLSDPDSADVSDVSTD